MSKYEIKVQETQAQVDIFFYSLGKHSDEISQLVSAFFSFLLFFPL